ncbi:MAG: ArsR/SmtB family transcription factor [Ferrimicrobium sp.]
MELIEQSVEPQSIELGTPLARDQTIALAELCQAIGDPTRLRILSSLGTACMPVGMIAQSTGLRQPTVSHHLRILRDRGLVRPERRGTSVYYCAASEELQPTLRALHSLLRDTVRS